MLESLSEKKKEAILKYPFMQEYVKKRMHKKTFFAARRNEKAREKFLQSLESFIPELKDRGFTDEEIEKLKELGHEEKSKIHAAAAILHLREFKTKRHPKLTRLLIHHATDLQEIERLEKDNLDRLLDRMAVLEDIIDEKNWKDLVKMIKDADGNAHLFFENLINSGIKPLFDQRDQRIILDKLTAFMNHSRIATQQNINIAPSIFVSYAERKKKEGKSLENIPVKEYFAYLHALKKKKVLSSIKEGEFVTIGYEQDKYIYRIVKTTPEGYLLKRADVKKATETRGPFAAKDLRKFKESDDWTDVKKLRQKGFLVVHATNAYTKIDAIEGIKQNIEKQGKYSISCSTVHPDHTSSVAISDMPLEKDGETIIVPHAVGMVLSEGRIYAAYMNDANTHAVHDQYKKAYSKEDKVPVRLALTTKHEFNELLVQDWKTEGLFYTKRTPDFRVQAVAGLAAQHKLKLYIIDEDNNTWQEVRREEEKAAA